MDIIYCLTPGTYWEQFAGKTKYIPRDYAEEGFIHATKGDDLLIKVANRVYQDFDDELLLLVIDEQRVTSEVLYEQAKDGNLYPHIYGSLNQDAIVAIRRMERQADTWAIGETLTTTV